MRYSFSKLLITLTIFAGGPAFAAGIVATKPAAVIEVLAPTKGQRVYAQNPVPIKLLQLGAPVTGYLVAIEKKNAQGNWQLVTNLPVPANEAHSQQGYLGWGGAGVGKSPQSIVGAGSYRLRAQASAPKAGPWSDWVEFHAAPPISATNSRVNTIAIPQIQIQPIARGYTDCGVIRSSGYVSSISVMRFYAGADRSDHRRAFGDSRLTKHVRFSSQPQSLSSGFRTVGTTLGDERPFVQRIADTYQSPPQPSQSQPASPTRTRTPFKRIMPDNPYACAIGSATLSRVVPGAIPQPGDVVTLQVTSFVGAGTGVWDYVEDTYRLPAAGNKPVTFANVAVQAIRTSQNAQEWRDLFDGFRNNRRTTLIGLAAFYNLNEAVRLACKISEPIDRTTMGTISCPPGLPWPTY